MRKRNAAKLIAGLIFCLSTIDLSVAQESAGKPAVGKQVEASLETTDGVAVKYLLYLPKDYTADGKKLPLMLFLHGRGESNGPLSLVAKWGPPKMAGEGKELPFILVSPQCPRDDYWNSETQLNRLGELLKEIQSNYPVDESRIMLTGLSMGGYGSWALAAKHPDKFSAVVPVCGGGKIEFADSLKDKPIWVFHGDQDRAVPFEESVKMVEAIKAAGSTSITFTSLEGIGHNCWSAAYATPQLYQWMLQQKLEAGE